MFHEEFAEFPISRSASEPQSHSDILTGLSDLQDFLSIFARVGTFKTKVMFLPSLTCKTSPGCWFQSTGMVKLMDPQSGDVVLEGVVPEGVIKVEAGSEWTTETG